MSEKEWVSSGIVILMGYYIITTTHAQAEDCFRGFENGSYWYEPGNHENNYSYPDYCACFRGDVACDIT